ncbi:M20 aminoacylase family protein [Microvirga sp. TS319]|uniref:M20 aminoacylase family protein n=1 Tax=Microvirga sp. TS319 TaxID=3241165 RepID=UPI00351A5CFC
MNATVTAISAMLTELTDWRRDLHRHPELMYDLPRTAGMVAARLREFELDEVTEGVGGSGILGILHGIGGPAHAAEKRVLFRADMDALPMTEATAVAHASTVAGRMHACGHDGHTVMLLGAARHLAETRAFDGTLVFCFQPAEEGGAGAQAMIDDGMLDRFPVKAAYALHNWPGMPLGQFGVVRGPAMASADGVLITVAGTGGHAAQPHKTRDAIVAAGHIICAVQTIVSRALDPLETAVVSITSIHGGDAWNVIPDKVEMRCNIRTFSEAASSIIHEELRRICARTAEAFGTTVEISRPPLTPYPPLINHHAETEIAIDAMRAVAGAENTNVMIRPQMGSEDFAFVLRRVPGAYIFVGNGDSAPVHNPSYDFNDEAIPYGVSYWVELANRVLPREA